jgi:cell wall-associated NlpC family hydrolase
MHMELPDHRIFAYRDDLAEAGLKGTVEALKFVEGKRARTTVQKASLRARPDRKAANETEFLFGEEIVVFDRKDGWAWGKSVLDGYVGYIEEADLGDDLSPITHWVIAPRTFLYPEPDMKTSPVNTLSMGSRLAVIGEAETRGTHYLLTRDGAIISSHLAELGTPVFGDYVSIAGRLIDTPYLWGGRSSFGVDCSGLVQFSMMMAGHQVLRDADMQERTIGTPIDGGNLQRGDLVFWKGHVGIMEDRTTMIHANGYSMTVWRERLPAAIQRIASMYGQPRSYRRP